VQLDRRQEVSVRGPGLIVQELRQRLERHAALVPVDDPVQVVERGRLAREAQAREQPVDGVCCSFIV
jgi:hypothetical protein